MVPFFVDNRGKTLISVFDKLLPESEKCLVAVAYLTSDGLTALGKVLGRVRNNVRMIIGTGFGLSDPKAIKKLRRMPKITCKIMVSESKGLDSSFHPKLYIFYLKNNVVLSVGSSNLTHGGLERNEEANIVLQLPQEAPLVKQAEKSFESWWAKALIPSDELLRKLQQAHRKRQEWERKVTREEEKLLSESEETIPVKFGENMKKEIKQICKDVGPKRIQIRRRSENEAIKILRKSRNNFNKNLLEKFLEKADTDYSERGSSQGRFVSTILGRNKNLILGDSIKKIQLLIREIFFEERIDKVEELVGDLKGIKYGFVSLLLYLKDRNRFNFYTPHKIERGLRNIRKIKDKFRGNFQKRYEQFNHLANKIKSDCNCEPQAMDIIFAVKGEEK
jgi:HKD family nuclease